MTNLPHLASRIFGTPLAIEPRKLDVIIAVLAPRLGIEPPAVDAAALEKTGARQPFAASDGVAVIDIVGTLVNRASGMDAMSGLTSYEQIAGEVMDAATDPQVKGILLRIDSPGGEASGLFDAAELIREAAQAKPLWASVDDSAFSAAYLLASAADRIYVTRTAGAGGIGIVAMHVDQTGMDQQKGLKYTPVYAGARKLDLNPHVPLTDEGRATLQAEVDRLYGMLVGAVARNRNISADKVIDTEARLFFGENAVSAGLADEVGAFREALVDLRNSLSRPRSIVSAGLASAGERKTLMNQEVKADAAQAPAVDLEAAVASAREAGYTAAAEVVELCALAGLPEKAAGFLARRLAVADVRKELLAARVAGAGPEIHSHVWPETGADAKTNPNDSPVVKQAEKLAAQGRKEPK